jgi:hypothetical protein
VSLSSYEWLFYKEHHRLKPVPLTDNAGPAIRVDNVAERERADVMAFIASLEKDIVEK